MSTQKICFLKEIRKNDNFRASKSLVGQVDFDHLLIRGQVIKLDNSSPLLNDTITLYMSYSLNKSIF